MPLTKGKEPVTGFSFDLTEPRNLIMTLFSAMLGFVGLLYVFNQARNRGLPLVNNLLGGLHPSLNSGSQSGTVFD